MELQGELKNFQLLTVLVPPQFRRAQDLSLNPSSSDVSECSQAGILIAQGYRRCL